MALTDKQLIAETKAGRIKPLYLLMGEEGYYIDEISSWFENEFQDASTRDFDQSVLYGGEVDMLTVVNTARRFPVMSEYHLVLVKEAQQIASAQWDVLEKYAKSPSDRTVLVLCYRHGNLDKHKAVYKAIAANGVVYETPRMYDDKVASWVISKADSDKRRITQKAATMIADAIGKDLSKISNELGKLYTLVPEGGEINEAMVEKQIGISKDYNVFELLNAIGKRDVVKSTMIVNYIISNPKSNPLVLVLGNMYNFFIKVMMYHQVENKSEAASVLGVNQYFVRDYAVAAANYSLPKLATCIGFLYETDLRSKGVRNSGAVTEGQLLKELVFKILH